MLSELRVNYEYISSFVGGECGEISVYLSLWHDRSGNTRSTFASNAYGIRLIEAVQAS